MALGDYSPKAPTDPCLQTLPHTAPRNLVLLRIITHPLLLSAIVLLTHVSNVQAFGMFPNSSPKFRRLASLPRLLRGGVRRFRRYYRDALTSCNSSRRVSFPSLGDTSCRAIATSERSHSFTDPLCSPGLFRDFTRKPQDLPSSRESSIIRSHLFQRPRSDRPFQTIAKRSMLLPVRRRRKLRQRCEFRDSIARHSDWLFTLHREDYSLPMQNSLPAVGQTLPGGLSPTRYSAKGFPLSTNFLAHRLSHSFTHTLSHLSIVGVKLSGESLMQVLYSQNYPKYVTALRKIADPIGPCVSRRVQRGCCMASR